MARQSLEHRNIRKLLRNTGGSVLVSLPIEYIRDLKWRDGQKVVVKQEGKRLIIEDWKE